LAACKEGARRGSSGVPVEFLALDHDLGVIMEKLGPQELAVRTRLIEAYRVLACPPSGPGDSFGGLYDLGASQTALECYRVDFGESPQAGERRVSTLEVWERLRKQPNLPMILRQTDLLPTLHAGLTAQPDTLWYYYDEAEKRVYTRDTARLYRREESVSTLASSSPATLPLL
jgi:hypothetical protein